MVIHYLADCMIAEASSIDIPLVLRMRGSRLRRRLGTVSDLMVFALGIDKASAEGLILGRVPVLVQDADTIIEFELDYPGEYFDEEPTVELTCSSMAIVYNPIGD